MRREHKMTRYAPMYIYATEMVGQYYQKLSLKGKNVLTTIGSGDQVLNAIFYGANEVTGFDINRNALFLIRLKIAAVKTLSYHDFIHFFSQTKNGFEHSQYLKIRELLPKTCQNYFNRLYDTVDKKGLGTSIYFRKRDHNVNNAKPREVNGYLANDTSYNDMRSILEEADPMLLIGNVLNLEKNKKLSGKTFDIINLSNIPNYLTGRSFKLTESEVISRFSKIKKLCSESGSIFFYSYSNSIYPSQRAQIIPPISSTIFLRKMKISLVGSFNISQKSFYGFKNGTQDRITILTRKK